MDRQHDLPGLRALRGARLGDQGDGLPTGVPAVVKPTKVTNSIRALRFGQDQMTQAELADLIGVTRQTVIAIEGGRYSPSLEMAFQIARVFNVGLDDVFQYPGDAGERS
ncbi:MULTISPECIES: helix-turn-helix transcriptional regulator [unclassified Crossiella]|uniref:helix-turn-helix transcriptional regulator n=1 Tax=unclassified Crossiella TaxID=2620835 RepID=UPI001FFE4F73|nr:MULTISPECIES: helix-turn-helix transcriptional regulator [unclassified Crossiella]MCK2238060.1 helix-turn-helix transcriptional regulator [Crossiella sp. S99.2]MCK2256128.1 helix-turn-helix transcriptional regulator [Crossiella sp. S99.1]